MENKQPTVEQSKELWERCGQNVFSDKSIILGNTYWFVKFPGHSRGIAMNTSINLNNLFEYAVPKLGLVTISIYPDKWIEQPTR